MGYIWLISFPAQDLSNSGACEEESALQVGIDMREWLVIFIPRHCSKSGIVQE